MAWVLHSVGRGYSTYAPHNSAISLVLQSLMWCARWSQLGYRKSCKAQTLGNSPWQISMNQDKSQRAAPVSGMSRCQGMLGHSPPCRVNPSSRVTSIRKKMFDILKQLIRRTRPAHWTQCTEMWSFRYLSLSPLARMLQS